MNEYLYGRRYRVIVNAGGAEGLDVSELRCVFKIEKSMAETPNYSEVVIYNLSAQNENKLLKPGQRIVVEAGYEGSQYGMVFDGDIVQALRGKEGGITHKLTLIAQDGDVFLNGAMINATYKAGQSAAELAGALGASMSAGNISEAFAGSAAARGKAMFGLSRDYLRQLAKSEDAVFYVNDRTVNLVKATDLPTNAAVVLSSETGLTGEPEQTEDGIKGKCLLNPRINLNSFVYVDNESVRREKIRRDGEVKQMQGDGIYRIISPVHSGDTRGDEWYTEFVGVAQVGAIPQTGKSMD